MEDVKSSLCRTIHTGQVAHAQLFKGRPGSAALPLALAYATLLTCESPAEGDACGRCASCSKNSRFVHPDVHFSFPVSPITGIAGKDVVSDSFITSWREFLHANPYGGPNEWSAHYGGENKQLNISREESRCIIRALSLKSFEGGYKAMIIWLPEYLHPASANALLKILEEPPGDTVFLLVTHDHERLLTTILSRTQIVTIRDFRDDEMVPFIQEHGGVSAQRASQIARSASGDLNEALRIAQSEERDEHELFKQWMRRCWNARHTEIITMAEDFNNLRKINQKSFFTYALGILRECLLVLYGPQSEALPEGEYGQFVQNFAKTMDMQLIDSICGEINTAAYHIERNANPKIVFADLSLTIAAAFEQKKVARP
jgi:DNA polymerase-3 subunit delta'